MSDTPQTPEQPPVTLQMIGAQTLVITGLMELLIQKGVAHPQELLAMLDWCKENARGQDATQGMIELYKGSIQARPQAGA
jgi:hypothetical protein